MRFKAILVFVAAMSIGVGVASASTCVANGTNQDSSLSVKSCGAILDQYGCLSGWSSGSYTDLGVLTTESYATIGANWNGQQYLMAVEPANSPAKSNWVEHLFARGSLSGGAKKLAAFSLSSPVASGSAHWLRGLEEWWWLPTCSVAEVAPTIHTSVDGTSWTQIAVSGYYSTTLGSATDDGSGGTGVRYAAATGTSGDWGAYLNLEGVSNGHVKVRYEFTTTTSAGSDNADVSNYKVAMDVHVISTVSAVDD